MTTVPYPAVTPKQKMSKTEYHRAYWQRYKTRKQRLSLALDHADFKALKHRADAYGLSPAQMLWQESQAYRAQKYLPPASVAKMIQELTSACRQVLYEISTHEKQKTRLGRFQPFARLKQRLTQLDLMIDRFIQPGR